MTGSRKRLFVVVAGDPTDPCAFLCARLGVSAKEGRRWLREGAVFADRSRLGERGPALRPGARVTVHVRAAEPTAGDTPRVLFADEALLALHKPAGLLAQPGPTGGASAAGWLDEQGPANRGAHLLHRLDREVSGLLLFVRPGQAEVRARLQEALRSDEIRRVYVALVAGTPPPAGEIELRIATDRHDPRRRQALPAGAQAGEAARTSYRVLGPTVGGRTPVELVLHTGRTHQLRVHLSALGHPVVGDAIYGGAAAARLYLHAALLHLAHPLTGASLTLTDPVPFDL